MARCIEPSTLRARHMMREAVHASHRADLTLHSEQIVAEFFFPKIYSFSQWTSAGSAGLTHPAEQVADARRGRPPRAAQTYIYKDMYHLL